MDKLGRGERVTLAFGVVGTLVVAAMSAASVDAVVVFVTAAVVLAALAMLVGAATEQLGARLGPGATGVLQSGLGNLPELFIGIFSLRAGLVAVVQAALVGSILSNSLLVLGLAFVVGGARHGPQRFDSESPRMITTLMFLAVAALAVPTLAAELHTPAGGHENELGLVVAAVLLVVFVASIPSSLQGAGSAVSSPGAGEHSSAWPLWLAVTMLVVAGVGAAFVSDWFVAALTPAIEVLHISQTFTGLVVVAIAGNAVENVVGIQLAAHGQPDYAVSVILNSPLQVALGLGPALVLLSYALGLTPFSLVLPPLLLVALWFSAFISALVVLDGTYTWLEGLILVGLYAIVATAFWWG